MIVDFSSDQKLINPETVGGKYYHLYHLNKMDNITVPKAFCTSDPNCEKNEIFSRVRSDKLYAVRSSSSHEDRSGMTAAGIFETYLNVAPGPELYKAINQCFNAIKSKKTKAYFKNQGISLKHIKIAVIIQEMVPAEKSGVTFTQHPLSAKNVLYIQSIDGFGEKLVSGFVNPDTYILTEDEEINDSLLAAVRDSALIIRDRFKQPQDIEWAWADSTLYTLQTRPIIQESKIEFDSSEYWTRANIGEIIPKPLTPLSWSVFKEIIFKSYRIKYYSLIDRFFTNIIHIIPRIPPKVLSPKEFSGYLYLNLETILKSFGAEPWVTKEILGLGLGFAYPKNVVRKNRGFTDTVVSMIKAVIFLIEFALPYFSMEKRTLAFLERQISKKSLTQNNDDLNILQDICKFLFGWHIAVTARGFSHLGFGLYLSKFFKKLSITDVIDNLHNDGADTYSSEIKKIQNFSSNKSDQLTLEELKENKLFCDFIAKFGHRSTNEFELMQPGWQEDKSTLLKFITSSAGQNTVLKESVKLNVLQKYIINRLSASIRLREEIKSLLIKYYKQVRSYYLSEAVKLNFKEDINDIFFLKNQELNDYKIHQNSLQAKIEERKKQFTQQQTIKPPFSFFEGAEKKHLSKSDGSRISGIACSGGIKSGRAVVINDIDEIKSVSGNQIIITHSAEPGWAPYLLRSGGMIAEVGGILSHIATIARENNIPMIVGVEGILSIVKNGQIVSMNGSTGEISIG